ncbi:MAG: apolipoprotein N-acyltransferase [Actinomycetota bacterium]
MARLAAAALSGVLAAVSRPPLDVGPLMFVALVPLFLAWSGCSIRTRSVLAFTAGAVYYAVTCSWMRYFGTVAVIPFVVACAAYWAAVGAGVGWLARRRIAGPFVTAALWVVADAGVSRYPFGGISWGEVGYSLHDLVPARTLAGVGGIALVTFAVVAVNGFVADLVRARGATRASRTLAGLAAIVVVATAVTVTRTPPAPTARFRVALVQGNDLNRDLTAAEASDRYLTRNHLRLAEEIRDPVDLIVFPESSMDGDPRSDREIATALARLARRHDAWVLANATVDADATGIQAENLDVLFAPDGRVAGTYAKRHLVPFGEYVPFRRIVTAVVPAAGEVARDYRPGPGPVLFRIDGTPMAPIICFESAFGAEVRPLVAEGAEALLLVTNNRSYRRSGNSAQHVAIGQMRAAETGRPLVHSAISGISALIDADGVVRARTELFEPAVLRGTLTTTTGTTPYVRFGPWFGILCLVLVGVLVGLGLRRSWRPTVDSGP